MAPDEFHSDAHPEATDITGDRDYGEWGQCVATAKSTGERCRAPANGSHGKCGTHGGDEDSGAPEGNDNAEGNDGGAAPEGNDNAATHELYSDENAYYQRRDEANQTLIDAIYDDYYKRFEARNGEPITGDEAMLFKVAVSVHKLLKADDWIEQRPETLDSGHPLIDRSEKRTAQGESYYEYVQSAVMKAEKQLEGFIRRWLKANDLHGPVDDGADVEVEVTAKMWDDLTGYYDED
ncbi:hypothetical protein SAMN05216388_101760 [Halorientalis persicus]|uniref:Uncharacterized protein n=1 Tax=Halorientalis persicus TaxID=1367881 RepID=A0A1H8RVP5_9EURY|nr:hypothetical protein [Halorientalis persicus]SEO70709.1 hypothetical protein SAMN05216388_101760 [Halorientalis persicus]